MIATSLHISVDLNQLFMHLSPIYNIPFSLLWWIYCMHGVIEASVSWYGIYTCSYSDTHKIQNHPTRSESTMFVSSLYALWLNPDCGIHISDTGDSTTAFQIPTR